MAWHRPATGSLGGRAPASLAGPPSTVTAWGSVVAPSSPPTGTARPAGLRAYRIATTKGNRHGTWSTRTIAIALNPYTHAVQALDDQTAERMQQVLRRASTRWFEQSFRQSTPEPPRPKVLARGFLIWSGVARAEGLEPPTPGFGDQRSDGRRDRQRALRRRITRAQVGCAHPQPLR
jgi:hypothetical protein